MTDATPWTLPLLHRHYQAAVELELLVIPPYLCGLYSLQPGTNLEAALVIRSVVVEEMLHMILAANVLNAVGGHPTVVDPDWVPRYPAAIPYHDPDTFQVGLEPFSEATLDVFLAIENPSYPVSRPPAALSAAATPRATELAREYGYKTVGAFYDAIKAGLVKLAGAGNLFTGRRTLQIGPEHYYASGGRAIVVDGLETALAALTEIVDQGEGEMRERRPQDKFDQDRDLAHYYRFNELRRGHRYLPGDEPDAPTGPPVDVDLEAVYPMKPNPRVDELPDDVKPLAAAFNLVYRRLLQEIQAAFEGDPGRLARAVGTMFELKYAAIDLLRVPLRDGSGLNAGPTFEYPAPT